MFHYAFSHFFTTKNFFLSQDFYILISPMTELKSHSFAKNLSKIKLYPGVGPPVLKYFISFPHTFCWFRLICIQGADLLWVNSVSGYFAKYYSCYSDSSIIFFFHMPLVQPFLWVSDGMGLWNLRGLAANISQLKHSGVSSSPIHGSLIGPSATCCCHKAHH